MRFIEKDRCDLCRQPLYEGERYEWTVIEGVGLFSILWGHPECQKTMRDMTSSPDSRIKNVGSNK